MQTAGVGYPSPFYYKCVKKPTRLLQINGFYRGYRQLLNKEKVFRERCKSRGFILLHGGGPVTAMKAILAFVATPVCCDISAHEQMIW